MNTQYLCPGCNRPLTSGQPSDDGKTWLEQRFWCKDDGGTATVYYERQTPRWYALVAAEFDKVSAMPLVLEPDSVEALWDQAYPSAEATVMEPQSDSPEAIMQEAAERTALAIAILAYGPGFFEHRVAEAEAGHSKRVDEESPSRRRAVDLVKEAYYLDPTVSHEEYGRLMEEADEQDQAREWAAEEDRPEWSHLSDVERAAARHAELTGDFHNREE